MIIISKFAMRTTGRQTTGVRLAPVERLAKKLGITRTMIIGPSGIGIGEFLKNDPELWIQ